ncbi:MAG: TRAP transporter small permease [bacterium]
MKRILNLFVFVDKIFARCVETLVVVYLLAMMVLVAAQVVLRNVFSSGISWADVASRHLVLWVAFLGAMLATRGREHIAIDALMRVIPRRARNSVRIGLDALACAVAFLLAKAAYAFVLTEKTSGSMLFGDIPSWVAESIIPFGFAIISLEYAIGIGLDIWRLATDTSGAHVAGKGWRR